MSLGAKRERLETLEEEESAERILASSKVAQDLDADLEGKRSGAKRLGELHAVVSLRRLCESGKLSSRPIKFA